MPPTSDKQGGFAELFEQSASPIRREPAVGDKVTARVVAIGSESVFVDLGAKAEAVMSRGELTDDAGQLTVKVGDEVTALVASKRDGTITLALRAGRGPDAGAEIEMAARSGIPVDGTVAAVNKGGVEVDIAGVRAFCPMSQLDTHYVEDPASFVGQRLAFRVTRYEAGPKPNVVLSRRALLEEERADNMAAVLARLSVGDRVGGTVTGMKDFAVFVDLGGVDGMIHISELGFERVKHPQDVLSVGDRVDVVVLKIEPPPSPDKRPRIGLSLKALQRDPWDAAAALQPGQQLSGEVVRLEPFGAFVRLPDGLEGLVHVSEVSGERRVNHPREALSVGQQVEVVVKGVDQERKRIALSIKAVGAQQEARQAADFKPQGKSLGTFADVFKGQSTAKKKR